MKNYTPESKAAMIAKVKATRKERGCYQVKFTWEQAQQMRHLAFNKLLKHVEIMKVYDVSEYTFYKILNGTIYSETNPTHLKALPNYGE